MKQKIKINFKYILPILLTLIICIFFIILYKKYNSNNSELVISIDGKKYTYDNNKSPSLNDEKIFTIKTEYGYNEIEIKDGNIHVINSDCKDKICIHTGKIGRDRLDDMIICAPHRLCIYIK